MRLGPGCAYYPAVSLSLNENLRANFGATPLRYPFSVCIDNGSCFCGVVKHYQVIFCYYCLLFKRGVMINRYIVKSRYNFDNTTVSNDMVKYPMSRILPKLNFVCIIILARYFLSMLFCFDCTTFPLYNLKLELQVPQQWHIPNVNAPTVKDTDSTTLQMFRFHR